MVQLEQKGETKMSDTWIIVAVVVGIVGRAVFPYLEKLREAADTEEKVKFEAKYLVAPIVNAVAALFYLPFAMEALPNEANSVWAVLAFVLSWQVPDKLRLVQKVLMG